jgi:hypothetical protein
MKQFKFFIDAISQCHKLQRLSLKGNNLIIEQKKLLQDCVLTRQEQINEDKTTTKTFLLCWNRLKQQNCPEHPLGLLPKFPIMEILHVGGYIDTPTNAIEFTKRHLSLDLT